MTIQDTFFRAAAPSLAIPNWLRNLFGRIAEENEAAREECIAEELPPHLRYDIGALDCMPPPRQMQRNYQEALESGWQRGV